MSAPIGVGILIFIVLESYLDFFEFATVARKLDMIMRAGVPQVFDQPSESRGGFVLIIILRYVPKWSAIVLEALERLALELMALKRFAPAAILPRKDDET